MQIPRRLEPVNDATAQTLVRHYVCSKCWGTLMQFFTEDRLNIVKCVNHGDETPGYVSRVYVEQRENDDHWDYLEAKRNLGHLLDLSK